MMPSSHSSDVVLAATYRHIGLTPGEIVKVLHKSQPTVSRLLRAAMDSGILRQVWELNIGDDELEAVSNQVLYAELGERVLAQWGGERHGRDRTLETCTVVHNRPLWLLDDASKPPKRAPEALLGALATAAAMLFWRRIAPALEQIPRPVVAVAWGNACGRFVDACSTMNIQHTQGAQAAADDAATGLSKMLAVPAIGHINPRPGDPLDKVTAMDNARRFVRVMADPDSTSHLLHLAVPGRLSLGMSSEAVRMAKTEILAADEGYRRLFIRDEDDEPLARRLDFLVMGLGSLEKSTLPEEANRDQLLAQLEDEGGVGNILWHQVTRRGNTLEVPGYDRAGSENAPRGETLAARLNDRVIGLAPIEHVAALAERSRATRRSDDYQPGVLAITRGKSRAGIVQAALELNCINHLVMDAACAHALMREEPTE